MLEVEASAGQQLELTMDENRHLEDLLKRAKNDLQEMKSILSSSQKDTLSKVKLMKNVKKLFDMMNEESGEITDPEDDTSSKVKNRLNR